MNTPELDLITKIILSTATKDDFRNVSTEFNSIVKFLLQNQSVLRSFGIELFSYTRYFRLARDSDDYISLEPINNWGDYQVVVNAPQSDPLEVG